MAVHVSLHSRLSSAATDLWEEQNKKNSGQKNGGRGVICYVMESKGE